MLVEPWQSLPGKRTSLQAFSVQSGVPISLNPFHGVLLAREHEGGMAVRGTAVEISCPKLVPKLLVEPSTVNYTSRYLIDQVTKIR